MTQSDNGLGTPAARRTERDVLQELTAEQQQFLKRVLEIELSRLHVKQADPTEDLLGAVRAILP